MSHWSLIWWVGGIRFRVAGFPFHRSLNIGIYELPRGNLLRRGRLAIIRMVIIVMQMDWLVVDREQQQRRDMMNITGWEG